MNKYPIPARIYIGAFCVLGAAVTLESLARWKVTNWPLLLGFFFAAALSSGFKVNLPGVTGTMSLNYIFMLMGILRLELCETVLISLGATVVQSFWHTKARPQWVQFIFNICCVAVSIRVAYYVHTSPVARSISESPFFLLALASICYFLVNTISVAMVISLTENKRLNQIWGTFYFWSFPYYVAGSSFAVLIDQLQLRFGWDVILLAVPVLFLMYRSYRVYLKQLAIEKNHAEQMASLHLRTIEALALAIEAKDECTHQHLRRVQVYATEIGKELKLSDLELQALQAAAILHDVGKLAVPDYIISKPGRLTQEEFEKMKIHPIVGAEILERVEFPYPVVPVVRCHHERWDGSGYPNGLKGEEIPIGARILAAVDCLDALASDRQYRRALPIPDAMKTVVKESGKSFDPRVVEILSRRYEELEKLAWKSPILKPKTPPVEAAQEGPISPATGFERASEVLPALQPSSAFLTSIAAARQEVQSLYELTNDLGSSLSLHETLSVVAARLTSLVPYDCIAIYEVAGDRLVPKYVNGENARLFATLEIPVGEGLSGWVAENQKPIFNGNPSVEPGYLNDPTRFSTLRSALAVPLQGIKTFRGVLTLHHIAKDAFTRDHLRVLLAVAGKVALAIENALSFQQAQHRATTDALTGLPNAGSLFLHLEKELERSDRETTQIAVLVCDLDGFKSVNDRFGHLRGNEALRQVAGVLRETCRKYDYVARMGGDEFVLILPGGKEGELADRVARLTSSVRSLGLELFGSEIMGISIGVAYYPQDGADADSLLAEADRRMYRAKDEQRDSGAPEDLTALAQNLRTTLPITESSPLET